MTENKYFDAWLLKLQKVFAQNKIEFPYDNDWFCIWHLQQPQPGEAFVEYLNKGDTKEYQDQFQGYYATGEYKGRKLYPLQNGES